MDSPSLALEEPILSPPTTPSLGSGPQLQAPRTTALQSKISSVLSASYADLEIRDSLETLDFRGIGNSSKTRRNLRLDLQKEVIKSNAEVVADFGKVAEQLRSVGNALAALQTTCASMRTHISSARIETTPMLDEASRLLKQTESVNTKQQLLRAFNANFLLSDAESIALTSTAEPVDDDFFAALVKAKKIHRDCQVLLGTDNQRLGLEILDKSTKELSAGFQKLYRWVQRDFKLLDLENPQMSASVRRALRVLAERPTLFQSCLDVFAESRERNLSDSFYAALTGSNLATNALERETQKPIEFSAHEPLRYVGDMLAWGHSAAVSEREALELLFISEGDEIAKGIREGLESEPWSRTENGEVFDGKRALGQLVDRNLAGVSALLKQRIEQVVRAHEEPVLAYKISNLILFYRNIFGKILQPAGFMENLAALEKVALDQFRGAMKVHISTVVDISSGVPIDLSTPEYLEDALEELASLLKSYDTSAASTDSDGSALRFLLSEALDPFLATCEQQAEEARAPDGPVFAINCLLATNKALSAFSFTGVKAIETQAAISKHTTALAAFQRRFLLTSSGLAPLTAAITKLSNSDQIGAHIALTSVAAFRPEPLAAASRMLDNFLPSAIMDASENVAKLKSAALAHRITAEAAEAFCKEFDAVEQKIVQADAAVRAQSNGDESQRPGLRELFPRTGEEIRILLS